MTFCSNDFQNKLGPDNPDIRWVGSNALSVD